MKVKLEIEFEVPDKLSKFSKAELREAYWEELLHYAQCKHLEDALQWHLKASIGEKTIRSYQIIIGYGRNTFRLVR